MTYRITVNDGEDIVEFTDPLEAVNHIQEARINGYKVEYTGDPFADFLTLSEV